MQYLEVTPQTINPASLRLQPPKAEDYSQIIKGDCTVTVDGQPRIVQRVIDIDQRFRSLRASLRTIEFRKDFRTDGLPSFSRVFGWLPRNVIRRDYCGPTSLAADFPEAHQLVCQYADVFAPIYRDGAPVTYQHHSEITKTKVLPNWRLGESPFTSGIINCNNDLKYHFDAGNFPGVWSCMLVLRRGVEGGHLAIPEFNIAMEVPDCSLIFFDGQSILHGVTDIIRSSPRDYRISIVYYSLQQLWHCKSPDEEATRIRAVQSQRAVRRSYLQQNLKLDQRAEVANPIFIPSTGRSMRCKTAYIIRMNNLPFTLVVHPEEAEEYAKAHPSATILIVPTQYKGLGAVRQFILDHCRANSIPKYWLIDDNISEFYYRQDGEVHDASVRAALGGMEAMLQPLDNVAVAGVAFNKDQKAKGSPDLFWNIAAQCCVLVSSETGVDYDPMFEFKSDTVFCIRNLQAGFQTLRSNIYGMRKPMTGSALIGGLKEKYQAGQHEIESKSLAAEYPDWVKITQTKRGLDVTVDWAAISALSGNGLSDLGEGL